MTGEVETNVVPGDFVRDTALVRGDDGTYRGAIPEAWRVIYAFGGVSMAVAVRAIAAEVARPDLELLSAHAQFVAPVPCTAVTVEAEVLRDGRTGAQGRSVLRVDGVDGPAIAASATFGRREPSPISYVDLELPAGAGRPSDHEPPPPRTDDHPFPAIPFHEQTDWRPAIGTKWWEPEPGWQPGPGISGSWTRLQVAPTLADGSYDPVALCVPGDSLGQSVGQRMGPQEDLQFFTVTLELSLEIFAAQTSPWVFQHVRAPVAGGGDAWGTVELFGEDGTLLAMAAQRARLRRFTPGDGFFG